MKEERLTYRKAPGGVALGCSGPESRPYFNFVRPNARSQTYVESGNIREHALRRFCDRPCRPCAGGIPFLRAVYPTGFHLSTARPHLSGFVPTNRLLLRN